MLNKFIEIPPISFSQCTANALAFLASAVGVNIYFNSISLIRAPSAAPLLLLQS